MDNVVTISNSKNNTLEFDVDIQGIETDEIAVRFVIETGGMELGFDSEKGVKNKWSVKIPALSMLDTTMYPFHINIVVDGYNFTPLRGSINVIGSHEVYVSNPENITLMPAKRKAKEIVQMLNKKPENVGAVEPQQDILPPKPPIVVKSDRKFAMEPLKVKKGSEVFKTLMNKKPKVVTKKDKDLDDKIIDLMKRAKEESIAKPKKVEELVTKKVEKPTKRTTEPPIKSTKEEPKSATSKKVVKKKAASKKDGGVKEVAEKIIHSVTGISRKHSLIKNNPNDAKIKGIINEHSAVGVDKPENLITKEPCAIKKISKDNTIKEINVSKEQRIKDALKESVTN